MEPWRFTDKSEAIVWANLRKEFGPDGRHVGFHFRNVTELGLASWVRGSMRTLAPCRRSGEHDRDPQAGARYRKSDEQYGFIDDCSPGPYLELFDRYPRPGWTT